MTISPASPVRGLAVKSTPATSAGTMVCTTIPTAASGSSAAPSSRR